MSTNAVKLDMEPDHRRVLLIDDDADFAAGHADFLEEFGYEVKVAHDDQRARETVSTFDPQIALIDLNLGNSNGIDLINVLREKSPALICIMLTGNADMESAIEALRQGANDFLRKPVDLDELLAVMERCIKIQRLVEEKLASDIARQKAEAANRAKSLFLSTMSHELRTPMNAILGFAQVLETNPSEPLTEGQKSHVEHIIKAGNNLLELITQVLKLNEIDTGGLFLDIDHIPGLDIIEGGINLIQRRADQEGIDILNQTADNNLPRLWTDREQLTQVLFNLLSNAVKYNHRGGTVTLTCQKAPDQMLRISVEDTGSGIPIEKQSSLFKPFERLGREAGEIEGAGIGLILTKQTIELLGGRIGFESDEGKGSTFWVEVPLSSKH